MFSESDPWVVPLPYAVEQVAGQIADHPFPIKSVIGQIPWVDLSSTTSHWSNSSVISLIQLATGQIASALFITVCEIVH